LFFNKSKKAVVLFWTLVVVVLIIVAIIFTFEDLHGVDLNELSRELLEVFFDSVVLVFTKTSVTLGSLSLKQSFDHRTTATIEQQQHQPLTTTNNNKRV